MENIIVTPCVIAALITSIFNIVISKMNNNHLKKAENDRRISEMDKYRYTRLCDMLANWHNYSSKPNKDEIANFVLINGFLDDSGRYEIVRPLLDKDYLKKLDEKKMYGNDLLGKLVENETPDGQHTKEFSAIKKEYIENSREFSNILRDAINMTIEKLMIRS